MIEKFLALLETDKLARESVRTIFDIGSRDGLQSVEFHAAFPGARIHAFECNPDTFPTVVENTRACPRITPANFAVNDYSGECTFYKIDREKTRTPWEDGNPGASSLFQANGQYTLEDYVQQPVTVACTTLDDYCASVGITQVDLIWMDLQGAELKAFQGFRQGLQRARYIYVELTHRAIYEGQPLFAEVDAFLREAGFERLTEPNPEQWFEDVVYRNVREKPLSDKRVVLSNPWGGLGDNLQYSTLPELFALSGYQVWVSAHNKARNPEISKLVWGRNPYVCGISPEPGNIGEPVCSKSDVFGDLGVPFIGRIERAHGFKGLGRFPKVYHTPPTVPAVQDRILIDLGSTSVGGGAEKLINYVNFVVVKYKYRPEDLLQVQHGNIPQAHGVSFNNLATVTSSSLEEYCSLLASCRALITVHSGAQSLAVSMRWQGIAPHLHCFALDWQYNHRDYIYNDVDYYIG